MAPTTDDRLLSAALDSFLHHGVLATRVGDISAAAGVSVGSLYHHFGDKEGLAGALFLRSLGSFADSFRRAIAEAAGAEQGVRAGVRALIDWALREEPSYARFLLVHGESVRESVPPERLEHQNQLFYREVLTWWRPHVHYGAMRDLDFDLTYSIWLGPSQEYCRLRLSGRSKVSPAAAIEALGDAAWTALRGTSPD